MASEPKYGSRPDKMTTCSSSSGGRVKIDGRVRIDGIFSDLMVVWRLKSS